MRKEEQEGEKGEGTLLLRGGGGAAREAEGPGDGFGVLCLYERHEGKSGPMSTVRGVRLRLALVWGLVVWQGRCWGYRCRYRI